MQGPPAAMRVFVTGATGLVGSRLCAELVSDGHEVLALSRGAHRHGGASGPRFVRGDPAEPGGWTAELAGVDAVIHLAGAPIASGRWTPARKRELVASRVDSTRVLVDAFAAADVRPRVLVCASATGYYGARGEETLTEASSPGGDFLARLCVEWEGAARSAEDLGVRTVSLRFGVVLSDAGGALARMLPIFRLGLGGPLGPPERYFPYVGLDDAVGLCRFAVLRDVSGPVNVVAPELVRMREFARALGRAVHRPVIAPPVPVFALRLALGELGESLSPGQKVEPAAARAAGYAFRDATLDAALRSALG